MLHLRGLNAQLSGTSENDDGIIMDSKHAQKNNDHKNHEKSNKNRIKVQLNKWIDLSFFYQF